MPCPYFEPQQIVTNGQRTGGRLPLFDEYDGWCHANGERQPALSSVRFSGCNHGNPDSGCPVLPAGENRRQRRFHLEGKTGTDGSALKVLVLEIKDYAPVHAHAVLYSRVDEHLEPEGLDTCERAQVLAFCRSYGERFPRV
ncbi:MAG: hypothetical protein JO182_03125 [Acidobacteriaceae bacterium]|nr:hypothetical protein [Acidobacteriaceae bacterium]